MKKVYIETIKRDSKGRFKKGSQPYNKEMEGYFHSGTFKKGHKGFLTEEHYKIISEKTNGRKVTKETKKKIGIKNSKNMKGKHNSIKTEFKKGQIPWNKNLKGFLCGKKHYNWQGGKSFEPYDKKFNNLFKRGIRKRDNQICMLCGIHREKLSRALDIHHINYDKLMSMPQNCISLCNSCHVKTNFNRKHWVKFFQDLLAEKYNYQYSENREIIMGVKNE